MMIDLMTTLTSSAFLFIFIIISLPLYNITILPPAAAARGSFSTTTTTGRSCSQNEKIEAIKRISKMMMMALSSSSHSDDSGNNNNNNRTIQQQQQQQQQQQLINDLTILIDDNDHDGFFNEYKIQSIILSTTTEEENNESSMIIESSSDTASTIGLEEKQQQQEKVAVCSISDNEEEDLVILEEKKSPVNDNNNNNNKQQPLLLLLEDNDERYYADRHAKGILGISQDDDCLNREFDYAATTSSSITSSYSNNDVVNEMIKTLQKCRILVIRNLFSSSISEEILPKYLQYVSDIDSGRISTSLGGTTNHGGEYFILKEDPYRNNYLATKELIDLSTQQQQQPSRPSSSNSSSSQKQKQKRQFLNHPLLLRILRSPKILGSETILNHVGIINAKRQKKKKKKKKQKLNKPQYWHMDGKYIVQNTDDDDDDDDEQQEQDFHHHSGGVAGHDLPPFAINMFTPLSLNITSIEYGPTEFCLGTSYMKGMNNDLHKNKDLLLRDKSLLKQQDGIVERIQEFEWSVHHDGDNNNNNNKAAVCPDHLHRIPLLNIGDVVLFDYMLTHRGGANLSNETRSMIFAMYSRKWYRDTTFDIPTKREIQQEKKIGGDFSFLTKLTRYAIPAEEAEEGDDEE